MRSLICLTIGVAACTAAPAYQRPTVRVAPDYASMTPAHAEHSSDSAIAKRPGAVSPTNPAAADVIKSSAAYSTEVSSVPFWHELGDSVLTRLIEAAFRANTNIEVAEARVTSARASRRESALDLGPTVTAVGSVTRQRASVAASPGMTTRLPQRDLYDIGFDASWELDVFGRVRRTVTANETLEASAEHDLRDVQVSLAAEVARTYFDLRGAEGQFEVARRNAENQRRTVSLAEDRLAAGRGTAFDTERARSALQLTLSAIPIIESRIAADRHRIATLLGRSPAAMTAEWLSGGTLPSLPGVVRVGSPEQLVRRRPDVLAAERQLAAQSLFVGAARAEYLPRLTLAATGGYAATTFDSLSRRGTSRIVAGPVLTWPMLDLGRVKARVDMANARVDEARAQYSAAVLRAMEETETALVAYDRAHARLAILTEAVRASSRALELAQQRFEGGLTDFLQVLDAQRTVLAAENQLVEAHTTAATALVAVYKAVGGTWPIR